MVDQYLSESLINTIGARQCGSRYFNQLAPNAVPVTTATDWDYFAQYTPHTESVLLACGFNPANVTPTSTYSDDLLHSIMCKENCQVVLRTDAALYNVVHSRITPEFFAAYLWKSRPNGTATTDTIRKLYNQMFKIAGFGA